MVQADAGDEEPAIHGWMHHRVHPVDLNSASEEEIADLPAVGRERARSLMRARPLRSWGDVAAVQGIGHGLMEDLRSGGALVGGPPLGAA